MNNFLIGHSNKNNITGVTVIIAPKGSVGGCSVRGAAPGTVREDNNYDRVTVGFGYNFAF